MRWYQWLLLWLAVSAVVAPLAGLYLKRVAEHYPPVDDD